MSDSFSPFSIARLPRIEFGSGSLDRLPDIAAGYGRHLLLVTERHPARLPTFEETREEIHALLDFEQRAQLKP